MTNKFKTLLKTMMAMGTLLVGSQSWGVGVWVDADTGIAPSGAATNVILTAGDSSVATASCTAGGELTVTMGAQGTAAPTGALTVTATSDLVIRCVLAAATANDVLPLIIDPDDFAVTVVLSRSGGRYSLQPSAQGASGTGSVFIKIEDDSSVVMANQSLAWDYKVSPTKTLTITAGADITGSIKAAGASIVTPAAARTINFD